MRFKINKVKFEMDILKKELAKTGYLKGCDKQSAMLFLTLPFNKQMQVLGEFKKFWGIV